MSLCQFDMASDPRAPRRSELAAVFKDQRTLRAFEQLFRLVPDGFNESISGVEIEAGNAGAQANLALGLLSSMADSLELIAKAPVVQEAELMPRDISPPAQEIVSTPDDLLPPIQNDNSTCTDYIDFPVDGPHIQRPRRVQWNEDDGTMDVGLYGDSVLQVGQEIMFYSKNTSGSDIPNGSTIMFNGSIGASGKLTFELAVADGTIQPDYMMGVATQDIANNAFGYITSFGLVRGLRTDGVPQGETWNDGDLLYFDSATPGAWTKVQPVASSIKIPVAVVVHKNSGSSGSIFVRMKISEGLNHQHDVELSSIANEDFLSYVSANDRWENKTPSDVKTILGIDSATKTYTATAVPAGGGSSGTVTLNATQNTLGYKTSVEGVVTVTGRISISALGSPIGPFLKINLDVPRGAETELETRIGGTLLYNSGGAFSSLVFSDLGGVNEFYIIVDVSTLSVNDYFSLTLSYFTDL